MRLITKSNASPAGGAQMKTIVMPRWIRRPQMGVLKGRFCMTMLGNGVMPSLASSWITRAFDGDVSSLTARSYIYGSGRG